MENIETKKGIRILVVVLVLIILSLIGYITYDKLKKPEENTSNIKETKYTLPKRKSILSIAGTDSQLFLNEKVNDFKCGRLDEGKYSVSPLSVIVDTNGDAYLKINCLSNLNSSGYKDEENAFIKIIEEKNNIKFSKYNFVSFGEIMAYKLPISDVAIAYNMYFNTGGGYYFVFVLNDGRVAAMADNEIVNSGKINITIFNDLNNILYITDCGMHGVNCEPFAVNNNGEEIYLLTYFDKWFIDSRS